MSPSPRRRVFRYREGDFVRGGRFCTPSQATTGTTLTFPPSRDNNALQRHTRPPERLEKDRPQAPPNGAGGCFGTGRVILSAEGDSARPHQQFQEQREHFHPPATFSPSRDIFTLQRQLRPPETITTSGADSGTKGFEDPAQQKARG